MKFSACIALVLAMSMAGAFATITTQEVDANSNVPNGVAISTGGGIDEMVPLVIPGTSRTRNAIPEKFYASYKRATSLPPKGGRAEWGGSSVKEKRDADSIAAMSNTLKVDSRQVGYAGYKPENGIYAVFYPNYNPTQLFGSYPSGSQQGVIPVGYASDPVGYAREPVGYARDPVGYASDPVVISPLPSDSDSSLIGDFIDTASDSLGFTREDPADFDDSGLYPVDSSIPVNDPGVLVTPEGNRVVPVLKQRQQPRRH